MILHALHSLDYPSAPKHFSHDRRNISMSMSKQVNPGRPHLEEL